MRKQLLLLRHAKSDWHAGVADFERPLSARGRRDAPKVGRHLAEHGAPSVIVASPSARTTETVALVCAELDAAAGGVGDSGGGVGGDGDGDGAGGGVGVVGDDGDGVSGGGGAGAGVIYDPDLYHGGADAIRAAADQYLADHDRVLIVAHNPGMEHALLAYCPDAAPFADGKLMPTAALAVIDLADADGTDNGNAADATATATLRTLIRPSELPD